MKKIVLISISSFSIWFISLMSLYPQTLFDKKYGALGDTDVLQSMDFGVNGGFILAGHTNSFGNGYEGYLIKTDSLGNLEWSNYYGGEGLQDGFRGVKKTSDGHYIAVGYSDSYTTDWWKLIVSKINAEGVPVWTKVFGSTFAAEGLSIAEASDHGYIIAGYIKGIGSYESLGQMFIIKLSKNGSLIWQKVYGTLWDDWLISVIPTSDGNFVACGRSDVGIYNFNYGITITKITPDGDILWSKVFKRPEGYSENRDTGWEVKELKDSSIVVIGTMNDEHILLINTDQDGNNKAIRLIGGANTKEIAYGLDVTSDSGLIICGSIKQNGNENAFLLKLNRELENEWMRIYPGVQSDNFLDVKEIPEGYVAAGNTQSLNNGYKLYLVKTDNQGNSICDSFSFTPLVSNYEIPSLILLLTNYEGAPSAQINYLYKQTQSFVFNTCNITDVEDEPEIIKINDFFLEQNYPNPFNPVTRIRYSVPRTGNIKISVFNLMSEEVAVLVNENKEPGNYEVEFNASRLSSGVYFYKMEGENFRDIKKLIFLK